MQDLQENSCRVEKLAHEKLKLHSTYLICILVTTIILLATGEFTPKERFTEYLANAATFVSVVLGLVAIFYSFVSNDSLSKSLGSINGVTEQIGKSSQQMEIYVTRTTEITKAASDGAAITVVVNKDVASSHAACCSSPG